MVRTDGRSAFSVVPVAPTRANPQTEALQRLVVDQLAGACRWPDEQRDGLLQVIHQRYGKGVVAILVYGSYLRGKRDTLLDFYVLLEDYASMRSRWQAALAWALSPNVYQVRHGESSQEARAKIAVMTLSRFEYAMQHDFHSYFWARFAQPSGLLYCVDETSRERVVAAVCQAASSFVQCVVPRLPQRFSAADLVSRGLSMTYQCELRSEPAGHAEALYGHNTAYYQDMVTALSSNCLAYRPVDQDGFFWNQAGSWQRQWSLILWGLRRIHGKVLSVLRLLKASLTFSGGFDYLLWKIGRHSGLTIEPTPRQRKYPLVFGWPLLWKLYRRGAFR